MLDIDQKLSDYILCHSSPEENILAELYRETYRKVLYPRMASGHLQGKLLEFISRMIKPAYILEIGTFTGYAAICLAKGLQAEGQLHTIEINDELRPFIEKYFIKSGLHEKIILHTGDAREIIPKLDCEFDLVFIDGNKQQYLEYYHAVYPKTRKGSYIIADNVLWNGKVVEPAKDKETAGIIAFNEYLKNDTTVEKLILPLRDGLMLIRRI